MRDTSFVRHVAANNWEYDDCKTNTKKINHSYGWINSVFLLTALSDPHIGKMAMYQYLIITLTHEMGGT